MALLLYTDGERRYILAPKGVAVGDAMPRAPTRRSSAGNALPLRNIPIGTQVHNMEMKPGKGGQIARSRRRLSAARRAAKAATRTLRLRSGEMRKVTSTAAPRSAKSATTSTT